MSRSLASPLRPLGDFARDSAQGYLSKYRLNQALIRDLGKYNISKAVGRCLISYYSTFARYLYQHPDVGHRGWDPQTLPAKLEALSRPFAWHTMNWESAEMIRQFIERGFIVDCIYDRDAHLIDDASRYDVIVEEWDNLPRWQMMNPKARKLFYATGAHWLHLNDSELLRLRWLFARRGIVIPTMRQAEPILGLEHAQLISSFGNSGNTRTFGVYGDKVRKLWIGAVSVPSEFASKDWKIARNRFLWFGGRGWVLKGLDLTIEAFLKEPQLELIIVGSDLNQDHAFWQAYGAEIKTALNITYRGWVNPLDPEFGEIVSSCCAVVSCSASENGGGAVVQCMHYGLIPLVTEITGLEIHENVAPIMGETDTQLIENIRTRCCEVSALPDRQLEDLSRLSWDYAHLNHTRQAYSRAPEIVIGELLEG